jgi:hypothetical protein
MFDIVERLLDQFNFNKLDILIAQFGNVVFLTMLCIYIFFVRFGVNVKRQAGAELCQAHAKLD